MKKLLLIGSVILTLSLPAFSHAQEYVEGEVLVKYKNASFQTTTQGIQLITPSKITPLVASTPTPMLAPQFLPCEEVEETEEKAEEEPQVIFSPDKEEELIVSVGSGGLLTGDETSGGSECFPFAPKHWQPLVQEEVPVEESLPITITETLSVANDTIAVVEGKQRETTAELIEKLSQDPNVEYVEPNYIYTTFDIPYNDTRKGELRGLEYPSTPTADIDRLPAMRILSGKTLPETIVAVIDIGIHYNHPDLRNQLWSGVNCKRPDGSIRGGCLYGYDAYQNDNDPYPDTETNFHGTHVAGTIAAQMNNGEGIIGVNPYTKIMVIRATDLKVTTLVESINFATQNGAKIINASW
jgi:subtilisin family serine protease